MSDAELDPLMRAWASPRVDNQSASVVQIESAKLVPLIVVLAITSGLAIGLAVMSLVDSGRTERETRMLEYYVMENDGKLVEAGLLKPNETWSAKKQEKVK